ncbi:hypothetical protein ACFDDB_20835 [Escherichia coli]|nr:hypothetical protein [Escherichia coli]QPE76604.1 hypothetical protein IMP69_03065 [Escherichia coli O157:H16]
MSSTPVNGHHDDHSHSCYNSYNYLRPKHNDFHITFSRQTNRDSQFWLSK